MGNMSFKSYRPTKKNIHVIGPNPDDRISELPYFILHNILSYLDRDTAARTCVLSQHWNSVWNSFPIIDYGLWDVPITRLREVDEAFERLIQRKLRIQRLGLGVIYVGDNNGLSSRLNEYVALALSNGAGEISFCVRNEFYRLPETVFVPKPVEGGFCPAFPLLTKLVLQHMSISESVVPNIVRNCPNINHLELFLVKMLEALEISNLEKLETLYLDFGTDKELKRVDIDAPSLKNLTLSGLPTITDRWLGLNLRRFPLLEELDIIRCEMLKWVRVSAQGLKILEIEDCDNIKVVDIDAPNLLSFNFTAKACPILRSTNVTCPFCIFVIPYYDGWIDTDPIVHTSWFVELRKNLAGSTEQRKRLRIYFHNDGEEISFHQHVLEDLVDDVPPMVNVESLEVHFDDGRNEDDYDILINGLFWSCRPNTISIFHGWGAGPDQEREFMMALGKSLLTREHSKWCCGGRMKHWSHDLIAVKAEIFGTNGDVKELHTSSWLEEISNHYRNLRFRIEWKC